MKFLITGGCGFIGINLIEKILNSNENNEIRILDNLSVGCKTNLSKVCDWYENEKQEFNLDVINKKVELVVGDVMDQILAKKVCKGIDIIIHLAGNSGVPSSVENPRYDLEQNIIGTFNFLDSAKINNVSRFIFASSGAPAGEVQPPIHEELPAHPVSPYGASKLSCEAYCSAFYNSFGVETVVLRFSNVYGPNSHHKTSVIAKFISTMLDNECVELYGDGLQTRDFIFVDDLVEAILLSSVEENIGGNIFQIGTGKETTISEIADNIINLLNIKGLDVPSPIKLKARKGDVHRNFSDISKAKEILGWSPKIDLSAGLKTTLEYFINEKL
jgi:UDP-glucose 4-epimerase